VATNPKLPPDKNLQDDHAHVVLTRKRSSPWPLVLAIIAAIILIALIAWVVLSKSRRMSSVPLPVVVTAQFQAPHL